jgi:uroporphyrinogen decarboxylase
MGDYRRMADAAWNKPATWVPLYDHIVAPEIIEELTHKKFAGLLEGDGKDRDEFFRIHNRFFEDSGYDAVPFECIISGALPGNRALYGHEPGSVHTMDDFNKYPWEEIPRRFRETCYPLFEAFARNLPEGMKGIGGPGNGVFECVQDIVGFEKLCIMKYEDEELFAGLFEKMGGVIEAIWKEFIAAFSGAYCVMRFGDDLGFQTSTLLPPEDIREHIFPVYRKVIALVHGTGNPFLLHCCGNIFPIMDELIGLGINAKHSNEDQIAPFTRWVEDYGSRIALFGGIDTDHLVKWDEKQVRELVIETCSRVTGRCGFALGSGNSIPDYIVPANYAAMIRAVREYRGEKTA